MIQGRGLLILVRVEINKSNHHAMKAVPQGLAAQKETKKRIEMASPLARMPLLLHILLWLLLARSTETLNWQDFEREMRQNGRIVGRPVKPVEVTYTSSTASTSSSSSATSPSSSKPSSLESVTTETDLSGYTDAFKAQEASSQDRLMGFYTFLANPSVERCTDVTRLLPHCIKCIPGLTSSDPSNSSAPCNSVDIASVAIRREIMTLTKQRFGETVNPLKPFALYPYLESPEFLWRQQTFAVKLAERNAKNIVDVGAYYNPINFFLPSSHCPSSVVVIEPILQAVSVNIPCRSDASRKIHVVFLPITFKMYTKVKNDLLPTPDAVVCIGCDSHYGPNRRELETTFSRPYSLYFEYPIQYYHNGGYRKMTGTGKGESLVYQKTFEPPVNSTHIGSYFHSRYPPQYLEHKLQYRQMKLIEYN